MRHRRFLPTAANLFAGSLRTNRRTFEQENEMPVFFREV
jgi:hypothetical protein